MKLLEHPYDPGRDEPLTVIHTADVLGLVVVMGQFTGRTFPDYFVATYHRDGTKAVGACMSTRSREAAFDSLTSTVRLWNDRSEEVAEILLRREQAA